MHELPEQYLLFCAIKLWNFWTYYILLFQTSALRKSAFFFAYLSLNLNLSLLFLFANIEGNISFLKEIRGKGIMSRNKA